MMPDFLHVEKRLQGVPVSAGIAIGPLKVVARGFAAPETYSVSSMELESQKERFRMALQRTKLQIQVLHDRINALSGKKEAQIFEAHLLFLEDPQVIAEVERQIDQRAQNAESVFYSVLQNYLEILRRVPDPYLRDKTSDIEDLCIRILDNMGDDDVEEAGDDAGDEETHILISFDLAPSDTASMDTKTVLGFATEIGSNNSHTSILARSMGIPAIVGVDRAVLDRKSVV